MSVIMYRDVLKSGAELQERVRTWRNSDRVRLSMINTGIIEEKQHLQWLTSLKINSPGQIVRVAFDGETPFGIITLKDIDRHSSRSDWGMYIGDERFLGRGLGRRMLLDLLEWAFEEEGLNRLYTSVLADNSKAVALYLDGGFHFEGRFERHIRRTSGEFVDVYWMAMFAHEWRRRKDL